MEVLADKARQAGAQIYLNTSVRQIKRSMDGQFAITLDEAESPQLFDIVLSTTSPHLLLRLVPQLEGAYAEQVRGLRHTGAVVVIAALKHQLLTDGTYWLNLPASSPNSEENEFPYVALVEHTNYMDKAHYGGNHLVYMGDYVPVDHPYFQMSEEELTQRFLATLPRFNPNYQTDWLKQTWVFRAPYAQPLPTVNHSQNLPPLRTPLAGLYWASMSQVYPWDRGTNYAVEIGRRAAHLILEDMA
jgi:protoporphyrinogen oxidase